MATTYYADIQKLYVAYFNRPADTAGLDYWNAIVTAAGGSTAAVSAAFAAATEYKTEYANMSNAEIVNKVYMNLFGRAAEDAGKAYWAHLLDKKAITIDQVVTQVAAGAKGTDSDAYANKVLAAQAFTAALDKVEQDGYSGAAANAQAKAFLSGVTTDASLDAAINAANLSATVAKTVAAGTPFTLAFGLQALETAMEAKDAFLAVADGDDDPDTSALEADITTAVTNSVAAVDALVNGNYAAAATGVRAALLTAQQTINAATLADAQAGVTAANAAVVKVAGLSQAVATLDAATAGLDAATKVQTTAAADLAAKVASYNVINGPDITVNANGTVMGLIVLSSGQLKLDTGITETTNPGITAVLNASKALEAADKSVTTATTTLANAQAAVDGLDLDTDAAALLPGLAAAMTQVHLAAGALPTAAQITTELSSLKAIMDTAVAIAALPGATQAQTDAATAATTAHDDFKTLVDAFTLADDNNPLVAALDGAKATVVTAQNAIEDLADAVTDMNEAAILNTQLSAVNGAVDAASDAFLDNDLLVPVMLDANKAASAGADIYVADAMDVSIANFGLLGKDALFIGTGYTLNTTGDLDKGNDSVLEVFIIEAGADTQVVLETSKFGSSAASPEVVTITLTGVDVDDVTLSNGIITLA